MSGMRLNATHHQRKPRLIAGAFLFMDLLSLSRLFQKWSLTMQCKNPGCGQWFDYHEVGTVYPGGKELEPINCPRCGKEAMTAMTSAKFESYVIEPPKD
ncbi:hypothetical protein CI789_02695 [Erwinia persicina]|uniref:hypothetical protein n=1 Tax=Erwinia persicina TaxID=55211 RepID=UPI000E490AC9|nr:hypothetical protein [Erwinia persicina]AXU94230.1 hypothetical protein CI789_02695 [Erwinia persicina]